MSALYIIGTLGIPAAVAAIVTAVINYRSGIRNLYTKYELEQQKELRELMGDYTGRMLEAAIDWDRRMMQLYEYWENPDKKEQHTGWSIMCPGMGDRLERNDLSPGAVALYRRDPKEYFYLSVVFRFLSLLGLARRFEAEAFYLDAQHIKNHRDELYFLRYCKGFLWTMTYSEISPRDGLPATDHFLSDKFRPMLDLCYEELGAGESKAPKGQPVFDWARFMVLINHKGAETEDFEPDVDEPEEFDPNIDWVLGYFDELRPVDYTDEGTKRRRWERLVCLHLLTLNFIATFGFPWQRDIADRRARAIKFLSLDNTVIKAFATGSEEWLGLHDQNHMKSLIKDLRAAYKKSQAIPDGKIVQTAVDWLTALGAEKVADPAVLRDKKGYEFTIDSAWLRNVQWRPVARSHTINIASVAYDWLAGQLRLPHRPVPQARFP